MIGCLLTLSESFIFNEVHKVIYEYNFTFKLGFLLGGFCVSLVLFTSIAPFFIKRCSASMFNISLVSQIFWSYLVEVIFGESAPKGYEYYIGFVIIICGIVIFNRYPVRQLIDRNNNNLSEDNLTQNLLEGQAKFSNKSFHIKNDHDQQSVSSTTSEFSAEKKYNYYRNPSLRNKANKILNNHS